MSSSSNPHFPQVPKAGSIADLPKDGTNETASNLDTARSAVSASSMSPEEKEREKGRLQKLVKDFAKEVVSGIPVNLVNPATAHPSPHFFQMDRHLTVFSLKPKDGSTAEAAVQDYSVKELTKIYKGPEVLMNAPNLGVLAQHCVAFDTTRADRRLIFVFDEALERDKFYTCLKILRMSVDISQSGQTSS
ncbi:unnamed protein product [Durusdinium trenchii]|uniref:Uncharacterized protein n=2 Tax=Durusdinium trenchii TaxID=1381693 RepID=A0ABP0Q0K7_9DINO